MLAEIVLVGGAAILTNYGFRDMTTDIDAVIHAASIIGILAQHEKRGIPITFVKIDDAVKKLYGSWEDFPEDSKTFIENALKNGDFENVYKSVKSEEIESKDILVGFEKDYPKVVKESNINDILKTLKEKRNK